MASYSLPNIMCVCRVEEASGRGEVRRIQESAERCVLCRCCIIYGKTLISLAAYQTEIDSLTKRAKSAESAFLDVYKVLAEAPDPYPLLEAAVVRFVLTILGIRSYLTTKRTVNRI